VQPIDLARSIAMLTPPRMDVCAPRTICELRFPICDFLLSRAIASIKIANRKSEIKISSDANRVS